MRGGGPVGFLPRRVLAVDLATGDLEYPDPTSRPAHPWARVLVRWMGDPVGLVEVEASDEALLDAVSHEARRKLGTRLTALGARRGRESPAGPSAVGSTAEDRRVESSSTAGPLVTVTIASFRNVTPTVACVRRVLTSSWTPLEVVVVDNDVDPSPLHSAMEAGFAEDPRVRWVHEPRQGLSFARNAGLAAARGEIVVFTDDDVLVDAYWVERLVGAFRVADDVVCVTGAILPAELETEAQLWLEEYGGFHKGFERQIYNATTHRRETPLYPYDAGRFGSGANMAFLVDVLQAMGGFAVDLGAGTAAHGGEDLDVLRRTVSAGHTIVYEPAALMWHRHRRSRAALRRQMFRYGVGMSATVTRWLLEDPRTAGEVLRRVPRGIVHVFSPTSDKNAGKSGSFPRLLTLLEWAGVAVGPVAYLRSRRRITRLATMPSSGPQALHRPTPDAGGRHPGM